MGSTSETAAASFFLVSRAQLYSNAVCMIVTATETDSRDQPALPVRDQPALPVKAGVLWVPPGALGKQETSGCWKSVKRV